jgi:hypothetical protein
MALGLTGPIPDASAGPADVIRIRPEASCPCGYRLRPEPERLVGLEGSPGPVPMDLRDVLDAPPIVVKGE